MTRRRHWANGAEEVEELPPITIIKAGMPQAMSLGKESSRDRNHLYFYEDVSEESAASLILDIRETALDLQRMALTWGVVPPPIHLHINSHGGDLFAGFALHDAIRECPLDVHTHIEGATASAATLMSVAGTHRTIGKHGFILIHQLSTWFSGTFEEQKDDLANSTLLMDHVKAIYQERTKIPARKLALTLKRDLWLDPETALKYGLVDEIRESK